MTYRVAIIGAGKIAHAHLEAMSKLARLQPCAIADVQQERSDVLASANGLSSYSDYKEMIHREKPDIVIVTLPHHLHKEAAQFAAEQGCHILLEKPMALNTQECDDIISTVRTNDVRLMVGHTQHYISHNLEARRWIRSGRLGRLIMINDRRHQQYDLPGRPDWFFEKSKAGGGILMNLGSHTIDKIQWLTDSYVTRLTASVEYEQTRGDVEGGGCAFLHTSSGIPATLSLSGYPGAIVDETELLFTRGSMMLRTGIGLWVSEGTDYHEVLVEEQVNPFVGQFEDLLNAIEEQREPHCSMNYSRSVVAAVEGLYLSDQQGAEITVDQQGCTHAS